MHRHPKLDKHHGGRNWDQSSLCAIAPGYFDTDMTSCLGDVKKMVKSVTPMKKFGTADDIAWAAVYLASDESKFVTGQTISPNGGFVMNQ